MNKKIKKLELEIKKLKGEKRKLVQHIEDIFHMLRERLLVSKDELSELLELLNKYKS